MHTTTGTAGTALRPLALMAGTVMAIGGCAEEPICPSDIAVLIASPSAGDTLPSGTTTDIIVRSNLQAGEPITLSVTGAESAPDQSAADAIHEAVADRDGTAVFTDVAMPSGVVTMRATATSTQCGTGMAEIEIAAAGAPKCALSLRETPISSDAYALPVLNRDSDPNSDQADFQATIDVDTTPGFAVELLVLDIESGTESSAGTHIAAANGVVQFPVTLAQGRQGLRATCTAASGQVHLSSATTAVLVDTQAPVCTLTNPAAGVTVNPTMDADSEPRNGIQLELVAAVAANDDLDPTSIGFSIDGSPIPSSAVAADGTVTAEIAMPSPGAFTVGIAARDRAGNACEHSRTHEYVFDSCAMAIMAPLDPVIEDANRVPGDGFQADIVVQVDPACAGTAVTTDCGVLSYTDTIPPDGLAVLRVTMCGSPRCTASDSCTVRAADGTEYQTEMPFQVEVDNEPPTVALEITDPALLDCGGIASELSDVDSDIANGVQIRVNVLSSLAAQQRVEVTHADGAVVSGHNRPDGRFDIDLMGGENLIVARAVDAAGNEAATVPCPIKLRQPSPPTSPSPTPRDIASRANSVSSAVSGTILGNAVGDVFGAVAGVNRIAPRPVTDLDATAPNRQAAQLAWTAPGNLGIPATAYLIKTALEPLTEDNFDTTGTELKAPKPGVPGTTDTLLVEQLDAGTAYYFGIATLDKIGRRSPVATVGPIIPDFVGTGPVGPIQPEDNNNSLGYQLAQGDFNGDSFADLAVAAPFKSVGGLIGAGTVYVYFGGPNGLEDPVTPDVIIEGTEEFAQLGNGLTTIDWGGDEADDLAVGAPLADGFSGRIYLFLGGSEFANNGNQDDADVVIGANGGWFAVSAMGFSLTAGRFDSDDNDDLIIGAPIGGDGLGGVAVLYGGTTETAIFLSDEDSSGSGDAVALVIENPNAVAVNDLFAQWLFHLGPTESDNDVTDDIGVAYLENRAALVLRGREQPVIPGATVTQFDVTVDLDIRNPSPDTAARFGSSMGSIADLNGDGAREIIVAAWREGANLGRVYAVNGDAVGIRDVTDIALATLRPGDAVTGLGTAVVNNATAAISPDINQDGLEDLLVVGGIGTDAVTMFIWYGGAIPTGNFTTDSADHTVAAPALFTADAFSDNESTAIMAIWAGDVNGDGLEDICWADYITNDDDGVFELLSDNGI